MLETVELQRQALNTPVDPRFIYKNPHVKGIYTTGDYVRWKLNQIFGPDNWSHTLSRGPDFIPVNERSAYVQVTVKLEVKFANGQLSVHEDVGVWPLQATRGADLDGTMPERYETVLKAAITDGVKACAEYLGICFRPLSDESLERLVRKGVAAKEPGQAKVSRPGTGSFLAENKQAPVPTRSDKEQQPDATLFWSLFNDLERDGRINTELRHHPEIKRASQAGDWGPLIDWLNAQAKA